jgi:glycosyltransferase involved in cell wall biosynthesis
MLEVLPPCPDCFPRLETTSRRGIRLREPLLPPAGALMRAPGPRSIAILYSPHVEAIVDGYLDLVSRLPRRKWCIVLPLASREDDRTICADLVEPDWYGWKKNAFRLLCMMRFLFRLRGVVRRKKVRNAFFYGAPSPWHWLTRLVLPRLDWTVYVHDPAPHTGEKLKHLIFSRFEARFNLTRARTLIVSYAAAAPLLRQRLGPLCPPILVAPLPMLSGYRPSEAATIRYDGLLFGRLEAYKGIDMLRCALESLSGTRHGLRIAIVGRGPLLDQAESLVRLYPGSILETAYLSKQELSLRIRESRMVLLPYRDATGTHIIQIANTLGRPVVCTDVGCFPEYVEQRTNGFLVAQGDHQTFARRMADVLDSSLEEWESRCLEHVRKKASMDTFAESINRIVSEASR